MWKYVKIDECKLENNYVTFVHNGMNYVSYIKNNTSIDYSDKGGAVSYKKTLRELRNDKRSSPLQLKEFVSLIQYLERNFSRVNTDMVLEWASDMGYDRVFIKDLLFQLALYAVDLITKGESNEKENKNLEYDKQQLEVGRKVEMEHTTYDFLARKIARDHLAEGKNYYELLERMEKKLVK